MRSTSRRGLVGIALAMPGFFPLYEFLFSNGIAVWDKGCPYPLIDPYRLREAAMCVPFAVLGMLLFFRGSKKAKR